MAKRQNIIPFESVGRIMEESGVDRVSHEAKVSMTEYITDYALQIGKLAARYAQHAGRNTVTDKDVALAEKNLNQ